MIVFWILFAFADEEPRTAETQRELPHAPQSESLVLDNQDKALLVVVVGEFYFGYRHD